MAVQGDMRVPFPPLDERRIFPYFVTILLSEVKRPNNNQRRRRRSHNTIHKIL